VELHRPSGRSGLGFGLATATMALWAVLPLALKVTLDAMDAYTITWYRFSFSALVLAGALAYQRRLPALERLRGISWGLLAVATVFLAANYIFYLLGLHYTTPANAQVLIQLAPLLLAVGGIAVFKERFTGLQWLGFGVLLAGLCVFFRDQLMSLASGIDDYFFGSTLMVLAAFTWAIYGLAQKQLLRWLPPQSIMVCIYTGCAVLFSGSCSPRQILATNTVQLAMLIFCALNTLVAYGTFSEALMHWEASRVGAVLALTPLVTIGTAAAVEARWPRLIETAPLSGVGLLGAGLVFAGSLLTALGQREGAGKRGLGAVERP
jgi:drug/metabolite transporter (DMT)-like permease